MNSTAQKADARRASSMNDPSARVDVANALNVMRPTLGDTAGVRWGPGSHRGALAGPLLSVGALPNDSENCPT